MYESMSRFFISEDASGFAQGAHSVAGGVVRLVHPQDHRFNITSEATDEPQQKSLTMPRQYYEREEGQFYM